MTLRQVQSTRSASGRSVSPRRGLWHGCPPVIAEKLFRGVLLRERKRADRFAQPFVLVLIAPQSGRSVDASAWTSVIEALTMVKCDTDVLGWFEQNSAVGMVVPEIGALHSKFADELDSRVNAALASCLDAGLRSDFVICVHRYAGLAPTQPAEVAAPLRELHQSTAVKVQGALKRMLDIAGSGLLLGLTSPIFLLIAVLIRLSSRGPVFFKQARVGEHGKPFTMLKFRTMSVNADSTIHKEFVSQMIKGSTPTGVNADGDAPFKIVNDPRVTAVGRLLRRTSLDELPQLWNVLCGDMSLVGPRPPLGYEVEQYKPWHCRRFLEAKPGITGLWQVSGRSQTTFDDMVRLDLRYAKKCSPWADLKILLATPRAVISGKGAR